MSASVHLGANGNLLRHKPILSRHQKAISATAESEPYATSSVSLCFWASKIICTDSLTQSQTLKVPGEHMTERCQKSKIYWSVCLWSSHLVTFGRAPLPLPIPLELNMRAMTPECNCSCQVIPQLKTKVVPHLITCQDSQRIRKHHSCLKTQSAELHKGPSCSTLAHLPMSQPNLCHFTFTHLWTCWHTIQQTHHPPPLLPLHPPPLPMHPLSMTHPQDCQLFKQSKRT